jgi:hypothetical protein
MLSID